MAVVLTIHNEEMRRLCGLVLGDSSDDGDFTALVSAEQPVIEYQLDPAQLAATATDYGLNVTLALGVTEILAGRYLQQRARAPGILDSFSAGNVNITAASEAAFLGFAQQLANHGAARLRPYAKSPFGVAGFVGAKTTAAAQALISSGDLLGVPPGADGAVASTTSTGLFGSLQAGSTGTDDADPPNEFNSGFVPLSDLDPLT